MSNFTILARLRKLPKTGASQFDQGKFEGEGSMDPGPSLFVAVVWQEIDA